MKALLASYDRKLEIDAAVLRKSRTVFTKALRDGRQLTRAELAQALTKAGVRADGTQRLAHLVMHSELDALICSGARRGKQFTYALLDERVPPTKALERDASLHALASTYFATRGPATENDFAWWSGLTMGDAKRAAHSAESSLESETIGGRKYWFKSTERVGKQPSPMASLLPNYDEFFIGLKDRSAIQKNLDAVGLKESLNFLRGHIATIDGQIIGGWKRIDQGSSVIVEVQPLTRMSESDRRAMSREAERFSAFLELPTSLVLRDLPS